MGNYFEQHISIHAPRVGGDYAEIFYDKATGISIHAPREGGDPAALYQTF